MGASDFYNYTPANGRSMREAFREVIEEARHEYGHDSYSGTIGTKYEVKLLGSFGTREEAKRAAEGRIDTCDKHGPAFCYQVGTEGKPIEGFLFFGLAKS